MKDYTIPAGYVSVSAIAVGDYVFATFGIDECYHSGPYEVTAISAPRPVLDDWLVQCVPSRRAHVGRLVVSLTLTRCPGATAYGGAGPWWINDVYKEDGMVRTIGGRLWVQPRQQAPLRQATLFALAG